MALSLGDVFLNFTAGAVERNNHIRDENVALALEDFKANKDLYQKIALDRYTRDSNTYDKELEKMDSLKSVYSFIENNNLDRNSAASLILTNSMPGFKNLDEKEQRRLISQTANSFETNYKTVEGDATPDGVQTKQVEDGFKIKPEQIKLTAPNMKDYLQDPSFWTNLQDEIKTGTSGPLTEQVLKLLGKEDSSEGAKELLNNLEGRVQGNLQELEKITLDDSHMLEPNVKKFEYTLPHSETLIQFRLLSTKDDNAVKAEIKGLQKIDKKSSPELSTRLKHMILAVNGDTDKSKIRKFVDTYMLARDSRALREYIKTFQPDIDLKFNHVSSDGIEREVSLPMTVNFFWPDVDL